MHFSVSPCSQQAQWDDLVLSLGGHPLQLWGWGELKAAHRWRTERITVSRAGETVAACQLLTRPLPFPLGGFVYAPRGPVFAEGLTAAERAEIADLIADHARSTGTLNTSGGHTKWRKPVAVSIEPDLDDGELPLGKRWRQALSYILPARTLILDLTQSEDELMSDMSKKHRQYVRKSGREESVEIRRVETVEQLQACLDVYRATSERADFGLHTDQYYIDAFTMLGEHAPVWASYVDDKPVAFLFLAVSDKTSFELYGGMDETGQRLRANYALKWQAICEMRARGVQRYDFGGLINDGVTTFKKGFASHENLLVGSWDVPGPGYALFTRGVPLAKNFLQRLRKR